MSILPAARSCPAQCPALLRAEAWLPCQPRLPQRPQWEIQRLLLETGRWNLIGMGESMFPVMQTGDRIIPRPQPVEDFQPGQLAVIRRGDRLVAHRVAFTGVDERGAYIVTQGDQSGGDDGRSYAPDVAGVVQAVFRGGRRLAEEELLPRAPGLKLWMREPIRALKATAVAALRAAQRVPGYRLAAGLAFRRPVSAMTLDMHLPLGLGVLTALTRRIPETDFPAFRFKDNDDAWLLHARQGEKLHARLHFLRARAVLQDGAPGCALDGWWLTRLDISLRWARCGLEERLLRAAAGILQRSGAETLWVRETPELEPFWRAWPVIEYSADVPARRVALSAVSKK